jgi:hypothetical protein
MEPWYLNAAQTRNFPIFPSNTDVLYRIPRQPALPTEKTLTHPGATGYFVDGVALFDYTDTFSYSTSNRADASPVAGFRGRGDGVGTRDAYVNKGVTFDSAFAHQAMNQYHYHANAPALRYRLGDHVDYDSKTNTSRERTPPVTTHSPIVAWASDGFPVSGPSGFDHAVDATSGIRRMISGFIKRDGTAGTIDLNQQGRTSLPAWASRAQKRSTTLPLDSHGPAVSPQFTLGHYLEDYPPLGDFGHVLGTDFDLDESNGRFCVTPDFSEGTYAYFLSIEPDGTPKFPSFIGRSFYGTPQGEALTKITDPVTPFSRDAPTQTLQVATTARGSETLLTWNGIEGARYTVESSTAQAAWRTLGEATTQRDSPVTYTIPSAHHYRATLSSTVPYDSSGTIGSPIGTSTTFSAHSSAPVITQSPTDLTNALASLSVVASSVTPITYQWFKDGHRIPDATTATFAISRFTPTQTGAYRVAVTNAAGSATTASVRLSIDNGSSAQVRRSPPGGGNNGAPPQIDVLLAMPILSAAPPSWRRRPYPIRLRAWPLWTLK